MTRCMLVGRCVACWPASQANWLRLRPAGAPEAPLSARSCLRPVRGSGQPRPIRRLGRADQPHRPCVRHCCVPSRGLVEQATTRTTTIAAPSASGIRRLPG
eukprot:scaffold128969_cov54-Phaeocystis_antarctica.AAC.7